MSIYLVRINIKFSLKCKPLLFCNKICLILSIFLSDLGCFYSYDHSYFQFSPGLSCSMVLLILLHICMFLYPCYIIVIFHLQMWILFVSWICEVYIFSHLRYPFFHLLFLLLLIFWYFNLLNLNFH